MNLSVIYHSETGNTKTVAEAVAKGAAGVEGIEVRLMPINDVDLEFAASSPVIIFGTPTYGGTYSWQMKSWFHSRDHQEIKLAGKLGGVFATENHIGGGADFAEIILIGEMLVRGMVVYSGGAGEGPPFTHFGAVAIRDGSDEQVERAEIFGGRLARKGMELFGG